MNPTIKEAWILSITTYITMYFVAVIWLLARMGTLADPIIWLESLAFAAGICLGLSFVESSLSYFFDFADAAMSWRKQFGLVGWFGALLYSFSLMWRLPEMYATGLMDRLFTADVLLGLSAMTLLTIMAAISNKTMMGLVGPLTWRLILRYFGYIAFFLLIVRAFFVEGQVWLDWLSQLDTLPPPRLFLTIYASSIIIFRLIMAVSLYRNKN